MTSSSEPPMPAEKTVLSSALADAEALLEFAVRSERLAPAKVIEGIVKAKSALSRGQPSEAEELAFWLAFNELSAFMAPVTAESLRYIQEKDIRRSLLGKAIPTSPARRLIGRMRLLTVVFLIALILTQIYWLIGSTIVRDAERLTTDWLTVQTEIQRVFSANKEIVTGDPLVRPLEIREMLLSSRIEAGTQTINTWNSVWGLITRVPLRILSAFGLQLTNGTEQASGGPVTGNARSEQMARFAQQSLALYILPLLYGLLGACTHILRRLNEQLERSTLTQSAANRYRVRLTLGAVAGPAIGLFFSSEKPVSLLAEISPFAIAFIAGYSVDLLFSLSDLYIGKIKATIEAKQSAAPAAMPSAPVQPAKPVEPAQPPAPIPKPTPQPAPAVGGD